MLDIPELQIHHILLMRADGIHIEVIPSFPQKCCPIYQTDNLLCLREAKDHVLSGTRLRSRKKSRSTRNSDALLAVQCEAGFVWIYEFVEPKRRYINRFRERTIEQALGSTAVHSDCMQQTAACTVQQMHNETLPLESERLSEQE
ncbi:hypothetical protein [Paenibacillus sp. FSL H8-0034]|uniref:hypothetical protein n=1 Tax=Paenibacillus sp. FSL H8-0034 TaxID=2954671 RepID=UPI0030FB2784